MVGGIELSANGQKFAWSIADYLTSLERGVSELLKDKAARAKPPQTVAQGHRKHLMNARPPPCRLRRRVLRNQPGREAFVPNSPREVGTVTSVSTGIARSPACRALALRN